MSIFSKIFAGGASSLIDSIKGVVDEFHYSEEEKAALKYRLQETMMSNIHDLLSNAEKELIARKDIIIAEAQGESWLQRNWRPMVMVFFAGLVGAHWMGFTAPNLTEGQVAGLLDIVKIGLGGYVVGRSGEKIVKVLSEKGRL